MNENGARNVRDWELFLLGVVAGMTLGVLLGKLREERLANKHCQIFTNQDIRVVCIEEFRSIP